MSTLFSEQRPDPEDITHHNPQHHGLFALGSGGRRVETQRSSLERPLWIQLIRPIQRESLDRGLRRHHITGIAISGTIGIGLFINSGEIIGLCGSVGVILAYFFSGIIVMSVMMCLSEMVSVRPIQGVIFDYPKIYVDPALGYAVGFLYWLAYTMSLATLVAGAAWISRYWNLQLDIGWIILILIIGVGGSNVFGVRTYGNLEWGFKWFKLLLVILLDILMICINLGAGPKGRHIGGEYFTKPYRFPPGFSFSGVKSTDQNVDIPGGTGIFLAVWTSITLAGYAFIGVELIVVTAGEAKYPRSDLPKASRRIYLISIIIYVLSALLVAFNVPYTSQDLLSLTSAAQDVSGKRSPFVSAVKSAGFSALPGFLAACLLFAAWTAGNTALYVSSRTLYSLARSSDIAWFKDTIGRTSSGGTPLPAIFASFAFTFLAFLGAGKGNNILKPLQVCSRISTTSIFCVYASHCIAFLRFKKGMQYVPSIDREHDSYKETYYKSPRQPLPAYFGLISCSLLVIFNGWDTFYRIGKGNITRNDAAVGLVAAYLGPVLFFGFYGMYKLVNGTRLQSYSQFEEYYAPLEQGLDGQEKVPKNKFWAFLSWIR